MGIDRPIDLTPDQHKNILALLGKHLPETAAWAYGSRVKWTARPESDLDLVVFANPSQTYDVARLNEAFEESDLPFRVDLFVWDSVPEQFRKEIAADHVILQEAHEGQRVPEGWREKKLGDVIELKRGYDLPSRMRKPGKVPVVSSSGITGTHTESKVQRPGVVTGRYGTLGEVFYISEDFWPLNTTLFVKDFKRNDPRFVSYLLRGLDFSHYADKAAVPGLNRNHLHEETVSIPTETEEQRAIAHILGTLDDKIELNRRMNETLEAMARAIFKDWFVQFGPTRAKAAGRTPYLAPELWDLFPDALDNEGKPVCWTYSEIGKEIEAVGGGTPSTKEPSYWDGGENHWATPKDLSKLTSPVLLGTARKVTDAGVHKISSGILPVGTVLLSSRAPIGYLAIAEVPTAINQGFIAMICQKRLPNTFVLFWCQENLGYIKDISGGSTFAEIGKRAFRPVPVVVPSAPVLAAYDRLIRPLYVRIVANTKDNETLAQSRDLILPKLMTGDIRVRVAGEGLENHTANLSG